jgi:FMN-dependent NADH-azoreductase
MGRILLHVSASPSPASRSRAVAREFIEAYRRLAPDLMVREIDLWSQDLPPFDARMLAAKFAVLRQQSATPEQAALWARAVTFARQFNEAHDLVFSAPMWNFGVPYVLKHYIDVVTLPGQNWRWSAATGYQALLPGKRALVVYSSAGPHPLDAAALDPQKAQMRRWLDFLGVTLLEELNVAPTLVAPEAAAATQEAAAAQARDKARRFASG